MLLQPRFYKVDFRKPPDERWDELLTDKWAVNKAAVLVRAVDRQLKQHLGMGAPAFGTLLAITGRALGDRTLGDLDYLKDIEEWSTCAVGDLKGTTLANFSYELHQMKGSFGEARLAARTWIGNIRKSIGLCTSAAFEHNQLGMIHVRTVDWDVHLIRDATIILDCKSEGGPFKAVSLPGLVGVLSGVAKGRFSLTINSDQVYERALPNPLGWGATFLLRWIFENCSTYEQALRTLRKAPGFVPFFVTICGSSRGQKAVVEITRSGKNRVYRQPDYPVAVANHYPGEIDEDEESNSQERQEEIEAGALRCKAKTLAGCFSVCKEVIYSNTVQSMVLHPRTGGVLLQQL